MKPAENYIKFTSFGHLSWANRLNGQFNALNMRSERLAANIELEAH